jgi:hypothetical protein
VKSDPYNLFIFNMEQSHYTAEFKKKEEKENLAALWD